MLPRFGDGRDWFFERRYGMFGPWGLYAIPAWHEQVQWRRGVPRADYERLRPEFDPVRFAPEAWLDVRQEAGMESLCVTAKHHDGCCLWDTMNVPGHREPAVNALIRRLQPQAVLDDRGFDEGDFATPERRVPEGRRFARPTEAGQSLGRESWGYREDEDDHAAEHLMRSLGQTLAMGGHYRLNVGPKADGPIPDAQVGLLRRVGAWFGRVKEARYADPASDLTENEDVGLTRRGDALYGHAYRDPACGALSLKPLQLAPASAVLLTSGADVAARVELTPRGWQEQWQAGLREARGDAPAAYLRVRGLPVDRTTDQPLVVKLGLAGLPA
jgi:alpha-L-fucosidase